jgi:hypothetical protein
MNKKGHCKNYGDLMRLDYGSKKYTDIMKGAPLREVTITTIL